MSIQGSSIRKSGSSNQKSQKSINIDKSLILSPDQIKVKSHLNKNNLKKQTIQDNSAHLNYLQKQNSRLRKRNQQLMQKLQLFSQKLDNQLQKRSTSQSTKQRSPIKIDQSYQLKNAYKKIEIYKRQIYQLKKILDTEQTQLKLNDYQNKLKLYMSQNQQLKNQVKTLNKLMKQQQRGLVDIGAEGYIKLNQENSKNKQQVRKLLMQLDQAKRKNQSNSNGNSSQKANQKSKVSQNQAKKKANSSFRMRTQSHMNRSQNNDMKKDPQQKEMFEKLQQKVRKINTQKARQKQIIDNLKTQLTQKDKELIYHKDKNQALRKNIKMLQCKKASQENKNQNQGVQKSQGQPQAQSQAPKPSFKPPEPSATPSLDIITQQQASKSFLKQNEYEKKQNNNQRNNKFKYPRLQEKGLKIKGNQKWNHHQFSSKIKQVSIYYNNQGQIKNMHLIYQKGQPFKSEQLNHYKYQNFQCKSDQFIQSITGSFKNGYLNYICFKTNKNNAFKFGDLTLNSQVQKFEFKIQNYQYPCALFGQLDNQGINRLGCFIEKNI